jgi:hypothetical protein
MSESPRPLVCPAGAAHAVGAKGRVPHLDSSSEEDQEADSDTATTGKKGETPPTGLGRVRGGDRGSGGTGKKGEARV